MKIINETEFYDIREVCAKIDCCYATITRYIRAGKIKAVRFGRKMYISKQSLDAYINGQ